jgi:hypothetical protein
MNRRRLAILLLAAVLAITAGLFVSTQRNSPPQSSEPALLPGLANDLNALTAVTVRKGSAVVTLHQSGGHWTVAERADYPADVPKLRKLLLSLRDARIVEEKTSDPARFAVLGVEDPADPAGVGAEVTLATANGKSGAIVGKPVGAGNYVRRLGENRSFIVEPAITFETEARFWIDAQLLDVPVALIQSIEFKPAAGAGYALHRSKPADSSFSLEGVPPGRTPKDGPALAPPPSTFSALDAEDVAAAKDIDFAAASKVTLSLTDGRVITLTGTVIAAKHWIEVTVTGDKEGALAAKAAGRAFEIASYRYDAIFKPVEQLLEPLPQKAEPTRKPGSQQRPTPAQPAPATRAAPPAATPAAPATRTAPSAASQPTAATDKAQPAAPP